MALHSLTKMIIYWIFLVLVLWSVPGTSLICNDCACSSIDLSACNCTNAVTAEDGAHCTIIENFNPSNSSVELSATFLNSSYVRIKDTYYIIVDETIFYNETTSEWETKTNRVVYGCDWDYCNDDTLISSLPNTFNLNINSTWLDENIYGNGFVNGCHNCSDEQCGNETYSVNDNLCPFALCDNSTTCSLRDLQYDAETNELCYRSECTSSQSTDEENEKYKVQIEAIVYLAQNRSDFSIWELNINCAANNCSRSTIFQEIKNQLQGEVSDLTAFPINRPTTTVPTTTTITATVITTTLLVNSLFCYNCSCTGTTCPCTTYRVVSADDAYCTIKRSHVGQDTFIDYTFAYINGPYIHFSEYPYVLVFESIIYDKKSGRWSTDPKYVIYGCNSSLCNKPDLVTYLPASFQMRLPESWLNSSVLGNGLPISSCHECSNGTVCSDTDFIDGDKCPIQSCNTTCLVGDRFEGSNYTTQCYDSMCLTEDISSEPIDMARVDIEGVLYASNPGAVELREIDIYCQAEDCSRPEIFKELRGNLTVDTGDLTLLFNQTVNAQKIRCFDCDCSSDKNCTCDTISTANADSNYCSIVRNYDGTNVYVYFKHLEITSSYKNIRELPFVVVEESILYDNETGQWSTRTNEVTYGCNWDYCNTLSLLSLFPSNSVIDLPDAWLNSSILGTGQPVDECNECTDPICSINNDFNDTLCTPQPCNTACLVSNKYVNLTTNEQCYQSYCVPQDSDEGIYDTHRVEIKGVIYPSQPDNVDIWEIYAYCQADNCSRPEIFEEIKDNLIFDTDSISTLFNQTHTSEPDQIRCYTCDCYDDPLCPCNKTTVQPSYENYCTIIRQYDGQHVWMYLEHVNQDSSQAYIRDFPYMLVGETILHDDATGRWNTRPTGIIYGCNWDYCNDPNLIPSLPITFQMRLPEAWLDTNILGDETPVHDCHHCPDAPECGTTEFFDWSRCPIRACNTTCYVVDIFENTTDQFCYQSRCLDETQDQTDNNHHRVEIQGIVYGNIPNAELELWEIDIYCRADDCSRPEIFQELQTQLTADLGDLSAFNITPAVRTTTTPTTTTIITTTTDPSATTTTSLTTSSTSTTTSSGGTTSSSSSTPTTTSPGSTTSSSSSTTTTTSSSSTNPMTTTGTTVAPGTTTAGASTCVSINMTSIILILSILAISLLNSY